MGTNYATIQAAVNGANPGDTILADAGTYSENVTVNKSLTLEGAQHGVDAQAGRPGANESVVDGGGKSPFYVTANNVTIDGFTVQGATNPNVFPGGFGILLGSGTSGSQVLNNIVQNNIVGLALVNSSANSQTVLRHNLFKTNNQAGPSSGTGVYSDEFVAGGAVTNVLIDANRFVGQSDAGIDFSSTDAAKPATGVTISNNVFDGNGRGLVAFNLTSSSISGNTFTNATQSLTADIRLFEGVNGLSIANNLLQNGAGRAVRISNSGSGLPDATKIQFVSNSISGYTGPAGTFEVDNYSGTLDATNNWWGSQSGPTNPRNPGGTGATITDPNSQVTFSPFLLNGANAQPNAPGFHPAGDSGIAIVVNGTAGGNDTVVVTIGAHNSGSYTFDGGPPIAFTNITSFTFNGQGNSNTLTLNTPGVIDFSQSGRITFDDPFTLSYTGVGTLNINNAVAVNAIAGPDTADRPTAFTGLTVPERFVQALFLDELGRKGATAELDVWLNATGGSQAAIAGGILRSGEARDHLVKAWYQAYLGRQAQGGEEQGWVNLLLQGQTEEQVLSQILATPEFFGRAQALVGSGDANTRYVQALFQVLLNRSASTADAAAWVNAIAQIGRAGVALGIQQGPESRTDLFEAYYNVLLHRPDDAAALAAWVASSGDTAAVRAGFESFAEFFANG